MNKEDEQRGKELIELMKDYVNTRYELARLRLINSASNVMAALIGFFLLLVSGMFFLFFVSYAIANYLSVVTETKYAGYFIVATFYLVITIVLMMIKEKSIHIPFENRFIRQFLK